MSTDSDRTESGGSHPELGTKVGNDEDITANSNGGPPPELRHFKPAKPPKPDKSRCRTRVFRAGRLISNIGTMPAQP